LNVFLALAFWTWLWGPIGAFLAVPLLIAALVIMTHLFPKNEASLPG
jgi:predicted PurR-regulated permease PerM